MKIMNTISNLRFRWFGKEETQISKRERFVAGIITTHAFSKLTIQNKMLSLGRLITLFRSDNGYTPRSLERALDGLSQECNRHAVKTWNTLYSKENFESISKKINSTF